MAKDETETKYQTLDRMFLTFRCQIDDVIRDMPEGEHRTALVRFLAETVDSLVKAGL